MKKIFAIFMMTLSSICAYSQYIHKIKTDSLLVTNDSCNAELNLENSTKNVNGFLYNKGNGRTEFRKGLIKLNDSLYIIGSDTLNIASATKLSNDGGGTQTLQQVTVAGNTTDQDIIANASVYIAGYDYTTGDYNLVGRNTATGRIEKLTQSLMVPHYSSDHPTGNGSIYFNDINQKIRILEGGVWQDLLADNNGGGTQTLQQVTEAGNTTDQDIIANAFLGNGVVLSPSVDNAGILQLRSKAGAGSIASGPGIGGFYVKNDGLPYFRYGSGTEYSLVGGGSTPTLQQVLTSGDSSDLNISISGRTMLGGAVDDGFSPVQVNGVIKADSLLIGTGNDGRARIGANGGTEGIWGSHGNLWFGKNALTEPNADKRNVAIGDNSLRYTLQGYQNTAIGYLTFPKNVTGLRNTVIGASAMWAAKNTSNNISIGHETMAILDSAGGKNIALGNVALNQVKGFGNIGIGHSAGYSLGGYTDSFNVVIGVDNNMLRSGSSYNTIIGRTPTGFPTTPISNNIILTDGQGNIKFRSAGDSTVLTTKFLNLKNFTPTGTGDTSGNVGDIAKDENYFYIRTSSGWKRSAIFTTF